MTRYHLFAVFMLFSSFSFAETPPPQVGFMAEVGIAKTWGDELNAVLAANGQTAVPESTLLTNGWRLAMGINGFFTEVTGHRVANNLLQPPSGEKRTRFSVDTTEVTFGRHFDLGKAFLVSAGVGVGVSKLLLQTYSSLPDTAAKAWAATGQGTFISDWNVVPVATVRLMWRVSPVAGTAYGWAIGTGASVSGFYLPLNWKQAGDSAIQGLASPWSTVVRPLIFVGYE